LDLGCGHDVLPPWLPARQRDVNAAGWIAVGVDADHSALARHGLFRRKVQADIQALPFREASFDLVTANMVLEHVEHPQRLLAEISRVLRPGGRFIAHTPNAHGYTTLATRLIPKRLRSPLAVLLHGRDTSDVYPTYYRANSRGTLRSLVQTAGLGCPRISYVQTSPQLVAIPPLMILEMLLIRALSIDWLSRFRACLIVEMTHPASPAPYAVHAPTRN
jgi:SAM-dependent methyltransferase